MKPEQKQYYEKELSSIRRGGEHHQAWMQDSIGGMGSSNLGPIDPPVVGFGQSSDTHYMQYFQNWEEVNVVIKQLQEEATKAWGENK